MKNKILQIREFRDKDNYIRTEYDFDEYTIKLMNYFFVEIHQKSLSYCWFNTGSSKNAIDFFSIPMQESDYIDFGDCYETSKDGIWSVYAKPYSKDHPEILKVKGRAEKYWEEIIPLYKKYGKLVLQVHEKHFPTIVEFLKQNQFDASKLGLGDKDVIDLFNERESIRNSERRDEKLNQIL